MAYTEKEIEISKEIIIEEMIKGNSLVSIIKTHSNIPSIRTVFNWLNSESDYFDKQFLHNYARAQEIRAENEFDQILEIADATADDIILDKDGNQVINHNVINRDRLRIDSRKWRISKMQPKKYGDKLDITSNDKTLETSFNLGSLNKIQLDALIQLHEGDNSSTEAE